MSTLRKRGDPRMSPKVTPNGPPWGRPDERKHTGNKWFWLIFGNPYRKTDFLYEEQFASLQTEGLLNRFDVAFSRDQAEKIYVQHRMEEKGQEIWSWLEDGATFYVCGDATRMARDVDATLHDIVEKHGGKSEDEAKDFVKALKKEKRYQRDVY